MVLKPILVFSLGLDQAEQYQDFSMVLQYKTKELFILDQIPFLGQPFIFRGDLALTYPIGRVKNEKRQLGITAIGFFSTILYGETEFTVLLMI